MLHHYFLPHKTHKSSRKHKKAHLLSHRALGIYVALFIFMQTGFGGVKSQLPGVLGTTSDITRQEIIYLTNTERQKAGISVLKENSLLNKAAEDKAQNMFAENYWAHVSPSGIEPWEWIKEEGYSYRYAGENLARGFSDSKATINAWMASPLGHKENMLSPKYQEIGIAVEDGVLGGEKVTLIVQLFGTPSGGAVSQIDDEGVSIANNSLATTQSAVGLTQGVKSENARVNQNIFVPDTKVNINPNAVTRIFSFFLIVLLGSLGILDAYILWRKKQLAAIHLRHLPNVGVITAAAIVLLIVRVGSIL